jgi:5-methylcytosine-specific restriction endonuclease McrA
MKRKDGKPKRIPTYKHQSPEITALNMIWASYKNECGRRWKKIKALEFSISKKDFHKLLKQNCTYCGDPPSNRKIITYRTSKEIYTIWYNGIDRKNSELGYSKENCVSCCKTCNKAKNDQTPTQFVTWIVKVYLHLLNK